MRRATETRTPSLRARVRRVFAGATALLSAVLASGMATAQPPAPEITDPGPTGVRVAEAGVFANYFRAPGGGLHPGVLLIGGSEGGLGRGAAAQARLLQAAGYDVLQSGYFGVPGTPRHLVEAPLETFSAALAWLRARPEVAADRIAVIGGSKGAEAALLVAARDHGLRAVVLGMPSSVVWPGISYSPAPASSWAEGGKPLPFLPYAFNSDHRDIFGAYDRGLKAVDAHPDAMIPVERVTAPILLVCGRADTLWPSCPMAEAIATRVRAKGGHPHVELLAYDDAGHGVFGAPVDPASPAYPRLASLGGTAAGNARAREDAWPRVLAFLTSTLAP